MIWEAAWAEYVESLDADGADWSGPDFVADAGRTARRIASAAGRLRGLDADFCDRLGI